MYADDHNPPHFHLVAVEFQVLVRISDGSVISGKAPSARIAQALAWAKDNQELLTQHWAKLNQRS